MPHDLVGNWRLLAWLHRTADGEVSFPFGKDAKGLLSYNSEGYMYVALMKSERQSLVCENVFSISPEDAPAMVSSYLSYCGRYVVEDGRVVHHVEMCSFPNWIGTKLVRSFTFTRDQLTLTARQVLPTGLQEAVLTWRRNNP